MKRSLLVVLVATYVSAQVASTPYPDPVCGLPPSNVKYSTGFLTSLHTAFCSHSKQSVDIWTAKFVGSEKSESKDCSEKDAENNSALSVVQQYIGTDESKIIDACGYRVCRLAHENASEAAVAVMKQVCGSSRNDTPALTETYFQVDEPPGATKDVAITVLGDPNAELKYIKVSPNLTMTAGKTNPPRLAKDKTLLNYTVTVPKGLLQREGPTFRAFYIQAGSHIMRGVIEFTKPPEESCLHRDDRGFCAKCSGRVATTLGRDEKILALQCTGMRPGAAFVGSYGGILTVHGVPSEGDTNAHGIVELWQYDDSDSKNPYHLQNTSCPGGNGCTVSTGTNGHVPNATVSLISRVPSTGNVLIFIHAIEAIGGTESKVDVDGTTSITVTPQAAAK